MSIVSATIIRSKPPFGSWTFSKTPHGPERSITFTPSEMTIATLIAPFAGGVSFGLVVGMPFTCIVFGSPGALSAFAAGKDASAVAVVLRNRLLFMSIAAEQRSSVAGSRGCQNNELRTIRDVHEFT